MTRNKGKGKKVTKRGRASSDEKRSSSPMKEDDQEYMKVNKTLGNCRMELEDQAGNICLGMVCGKMKKRVYIRVGDLVLVSIREFQHGKVDILHKYGYSEILYLIRKHQIKNDFVDVDTMFTDAHTSKPTKNKNDEEIDYPSSSGEEEEEENMILVDEQNMSDDSTESELDFDDI